MEPARSGTYIESDGASSPGIRPDRRRLESGISALAGRRQTFADANSAYASSWQATLNTRSARRILHRSTAFRQLPAQLCEQLAQRFAVRSAVEMAGDRRFDGLGLAQDCQPDQPGDRHGPARPDLTARVHGPARQARGVPGVVVFRKRFSWNSIRQWSGRWRMIASAVRDMARCGTLRVDGAFTVSFIRAFGNRMVVRYRRGKA